MAFPFLAKKEIMAKIIKIEIICEDEDYCKITENLYELNHEIDMICGDWFDIVTKTVKGEE